MRVHELAKQINVQNSDIIDVLKTIDSSKDYKAVSSIRDEDIPKVKEKLHKDKDTAAGAKERKAQQPRSQQKPQEAPVSVQQSGAASPDKEKRPVKKPEEKGGQKPQQNHAARDGGTQSNAAKTGEEKKKSHISQVYNPQNSSRGNYNGGRDNRSNGYNRSNGDNRGGYNRPNGDNRSNSYNRSNGDNRGGYNRPNGDNRGGYNRSNGDNRGSYNRPNGDNRSGYNRPNGDNRSGNNRPNGDNRGGYNHPNGDNRGGYNRPNGDNRGGYNNGNRPNNTGRNTGRRDNFKSEPMREEFSLQKDTRRADNRKNNDRRDVRDREAKENLKFANQKKHMVQKPAKEEETIKNLVLPDVLTVKELADKMKVQPSAVVKKLFLQGKVVTINQELDYDAAEEIALEFNCICEHEVKVDIIAELLKEEEEDPSTMITRPPVVCVMGHVDHGKTSLLDAIRSTNVTAKESGGITQKIGAYTVEINGQKITFLDTPGHEAFTAMRMRGAQSTDIAILVVAADDGVMPQTVEAINHAKAAGIDIIVAINKIDKPNANIERVKQELTEYELVPEDWGGSTIFCPVSAHTKEGIDNLLEMILLDAEVLELKANPNRKARGLVIEAQLDKGRGPVANILVQKGTLKVGDNIAAGTCYGKIRAMMDDKGNSVKQAGPSTPVEILGLNDVPNAGEIIVATENDKEARNFAETFIRAGREKLLDDTKAKLSLDDLFSQIQAGNIKELNLIVKADVQGSVEAVRSSLLKLSNEEVVVKIIHGGVGNINESDVTLASASNAIIIGFNVKPDNQAQAVAEREKVDMRLYKVIYNAIEDVESALKGMLEPKYEEKVTGKIVVRQIYKASQVGVIAGSYVMEGYVTKNASVRLKRGDEQLYDGPIASLKRFKDDVKEVKEGYECGIVLEKFNNIAEDDVMEAYEMVEIPR